MLNKFNDLHNFLLFKIFDLSILINKLKNKIIVLFEYYLKKII